MTPATPLPSVIGAQIRRIRAARGWSQDEMARTLRTCGLPWDRSTVAKVERGTRDLSLEEAVLVCTGLLVPLSDLVPLKGSVQLGQTSVTVGAVQKFLAGGSPDGALVRQALGGQPRLAVKQAGEVLTAHYESHRADAERLYGGPVPGAVVLDAISAMKGEPERKAAAKLKVDPFVLSLCAQMLWGRSLTEERNRRIGEQTADDADTRTLQALRGHTTRALINELRDRLEQQ